jgi:Zn finger protein HypA/HybF involved in hydrogenase expression
MTAQKVKVTRWRCQCERCGGEWISRTEDLPETCSKCRSPYWNKPRKKH